MAAAGLQLLKIQLAKCRQMISNNSGSRGTEWLNNFCGDFYIFATRLHAFIACEVKEELIENNTLDTIFLCLAQVCLCTKYLERVICAEETARTAISTCRQHFVERILWCLDRLKHVATELAIFPAESKTSAQLMACYGFIDFVDIALDHVKPYTTYLDDQGIASQTVKEHENALDTSNEICLAARFIVSHTLALANVALNEDKAALSALCQKVLRESLEFQQECRLSLQHSSTNNWNRKLKAIALEEALTQLEHYVDETILRLIFICFMDLEKFSLDNLRAKRRHCGSDDSALDEFVADFDVNLDRLAQIGLFAANAAHNPKLKTLVRSCMASLEALDPCLIPAVQSRNDGDVYCEILEQHFSEEITKFKIAIQEIVNGKPLTCCFYEILSECVKQTEKHFNKSKLDDMVLMGEFFLQYFQYPSNKKVLQVLQQSKCNPLELYQKFILMLQECRAILVCADQVNHKRILKRFKILRAITRKFMNALNDSTEGLKKTGETKQTRLQPAGKTHTIDLNDSHSTLETIEPSVCSILYRKDAAPFASRRCVSKSMNGNNSKCSLKPVQAKTKNGEVKRNMELPSTEWPKLPEQRRGSSVRRKESLRTVMFKRQKCAETQNACDFYMRSSATLEISEILEQLTQISLISSISAEDDLLNTSRIE